MSIKYEVIIANESTGVWSWINWKDFLAFLTLMHSATLADIVNTNKPDAFDASYVWREFPGAYPITKTYHYKKVFKESFK